VRPRRRSRRSIFSPVNSSAGSFVFSYEDVMDDLEALYRGRVRLVYAMALAQDPDPTRAEDLTQETFLRAWRHTERLATMDPPAQRAWLIRTVRHLAIDAWRWERAFPHEALAPSCPSLPPADRVALRLDVVRALGTLEAGEARFGREADSAGGRAPGDRQIVLLLLDGHEAGRGRNRADVLWAVRD
jgi:DNA-directed RNA polymerase specialized sigma24 family protein